jgi:hypothetical protein
VAVPVVTPDTTPVAGTTEATAALLLLHVPPGVALESVLVALRHISVNPVIAAGFGFIKAVSDPNEEQIPFVAVAVYAITAGDEMPVGCIYTGLRAAPL